MITRIDTRRRGATSTLAVVLAFVAVSAAAPSSHAVKLKPSVVRRKAPRDHADRRPRALLLEGISSEARAILAARGLKVKEMKRALGKRRLRRALRDVTVLGTRSGTQVTSAVLDAAPRLRAIGSFGVGTNNVDVAAASERGIPVFNAPTSSTRSVAELTIGQLLMLARGIGDRSMLMRLGLWKKDSNSIEVTGKTIGIVGYGNIGSAVGALAESLGMRVLYHDIADKQPKGRHTQVASLDELLRQSRFVTLHVPGTPSTRGMIGADQIALMPRGSYLINNSRGDVVETAAVRAALKDRHLAGAALDVHPGEPRKPLALYRSSIRFLSNVVLTSHVGGATTEAQSRIAAHVAGALSNYLATGAPNGAVNADQVSERGRGPTGDDR